MLVAYAVISPELMNGSNKPAGGPLCGLRIVELGGIGPVPFAGMMLADMGAEVIRIERPPELRVGGTPYPHNLLLRGRRSFAIDLRRPQAARAVMNLIKTADGLIEGFRPGVAERLQLGPAECMKGNPRLVYGRMTGWGQDGPLSQAAGHDINYIALSGVLSAIGPSDGAPTLPLNLVGDFGGGGLMLAFGMVCGLIEAKSSNCGQVIDAAMVDGASLLATYIHGLLALGTWRPERGTNLLDGGAPFYNVYATSDEQFVSIGAIEPHFYNVLIEKLGLASQDLPLQMDRTKWPQMKEQFAAVFRTKTREEWMKLLEGTDACFAPVLGLQESASHAHNRSRKGFVTIGSVTQPAPAPRFSRTPGGIRSSPPLPGQDTTDILTELGYSPSEIHDIARGTADGPRVDQ